MELGILFWVAVIGGISATISAICDLIGVYRGRTMESLGSPAPRRHYIVIGLLLLLTWGAVGFDLYSRSIHAGFQWDESRPLIQVRDKTFKSETVILDGREFISCTFDNVTFEYQGTAPTRLTDSRIKIPKEGDQMVRLRSTNPIVGQTWILGHSIFQASGVSIANLSIEVAP